LFDQMLVIEPSVLIKFCSCFMYSV
jgi:hypothetical protein